MDERSAPAADEIIVSYHLIREIDGIAQPEEEVTKEQYVEAERLAGFHPADTVVTEPISDSWVSGGRGVRAARIQRRPAIRLSDSEIFTAAADLIEAHGHVKGVYGDPERGFCTGGAVRWVCGAQGMRPGGWHMDQWIRLLQRMEAVTATRWGMGLTIWNDRPLRTKEEAVSFLREMATEVIGGGSADGA